MFVGGAGDVHALARRKGISIEMAARELRHQFLAQAAETCGACKIVLAHHADDQVETFWLRLLRGQAGPGLAGMRWSGPSPAKPTLPMIRPLLNLSKEEIHEAARFLPVQFREDSSNAALDHQRNQLRRELLPVLRAYQPELRAITLRAIEVLAAEKEHLREVAGQDLDFARAHPAVQREKIRQQLVTLGIAPDFDIIERLRKSEAQVMIAAGKVVARNAQGELAVSELGRVVFDAAERWIDARQAGSLAWGGLALEWRCELGGAFEPAAGGERFDADAVGADVLLRHWRPGDRFRPIGMSTAVKLQDLFVNAKVPEAERRRRVIAARSSGEIFWVEGLRIGEAAKCTGATQRILRWKWERKDGCAVKNL
jgi:tRNA(Ile)-lysidine synthase